MTAWRRPLPRLQAALRGRYPNVVFDHCVLQKNSVEPEPFQTVCFYGRRDDLEFIPQQAFPDLGDHGTFDDDVGNRWITHYRAPHWYVVWHSRAAGDEPPANARKWPQKGIQRQVDRMLRKAFARPKACASS